MNSENWVVALVIIWSIWRVPKQRIFIRAHQRCYKYYLIKSSITCWIPPPSPSRKQERVLGAIRQEVTSRLVRARSAQHQLRQGDITVLAQTLSAPKPTDIVRNEDSQLSSRCTGGFEQSSLRNVFLRIHKGDYAERLDLLRQ